MPKPGQPHNEWFYPVSLGNRKSCPACGAKLGGSVILSWGEYIRAKFRNVDYCCAHCFRQRVLSRLKAHTDDCGCVINLVMRSGYGADRPDWLPYTVAETAETCEQKGGRNV